ncbi:MAG: transposase [candidate division Zixibacteria bacterium]|nr:transposase [candidate division Zixibacteria bacterium]
MGLRFPSQKNADCFFVTTTYKDWLKLGEIPGFYQALIDNLKFYLKKYNATLAGYVLMPDHLHFIIFINGVELSAFMRDFKKYVSQKIVKDYKINESSIWFPRYDRVVIFSEDIMRTKLEYIHNNPVKRGLVKEAIDWEWSSAGVCLGGKAGNIPIWKKW